MLHRLYEDGAFVHSCVLYEDGMEKASARHEAALVDASDIIVYKKIRKRGAKISVFRCLKRYFGQERPWGA